MTSTWEESGSLIFYQIGSCFWSDGCGTFSVVFDSELDEVQDEEEDELFDFEDTDETVFQVI